MKRALVLIAKLSLFASLFFFVIFSVLANIGGNSDVLRGSIERYVSEGTGYKTHVGTLNSMQFFPDIVIDIQDLKLENSDHQTVIAADKFKIAFSFFDVLFSRSRFRALEIENFSVAPGFWMQPGLMVKSMRLLEQNGQGRLLFEGILGNTPVSGLAGMAVEGSPARRKFSFEKSWIFEIILEKTALRGTLEKNPKADLKIEPFSLTEDKQPVLSGFLDVNRIGQGQFGITGHLESQPNQSILKPDFIISALPFSVSGRLESEKFVYEDFFKTAPLRRVFGKLTDILLKPAAPQSEPFFPALDLNLQAEEVIVSGVVWGNVEAKLIAKDRSVSLNPITGKIWGGNLSGTFDQQETKEKTKMAIDLKVSDIQYPQQQKLQGKTQSKSGYADARIILSAEAQDQKFLYEQLAGHAIFVGSEGEVSSDVFDLLGKDLARSILPETDQGRLTLNCAVLNFDIQADKAHAKSIFIEAKDFTITSQAHINLSSNNAEAMIEKKSKIGNADKPSLVLSLNGPIGEMTIKPSTAKSASQGLVRQAKAPEFSALSLDGIELAADHPCKQYVIESEVLAPPVFEKTAP
jgi:hypothetical protein